MKKQYKMLCFTNGHPHPKLENNWYVYRTALQESDPHKSRVTRGTITDVLGWAASLVFRLMYN